MAKRHQAHPRRTSADLDSRTGLRNREKLFADLDDASAAASGPKLMVIFELVGVKRHTDDHGSAESDKLLARLANRLVGEVGSSGICYRLRGTEFCALVDDPVSTRSALLDALAAALTDNAGGYEIGAVFGAVVLPDEAADAIDALELADQRLNLQRRAIGAEPQRLFEAAPAPEAQPGRSSGRIIASFFGGYDNVA